MSYSRKRRRTNTYRKVYGYGDYNYGGRIARGIGGALGGLAGTLIPVPGASAVTKWMGDAAGGLFHKITGIGDYEDQKLMGIQTGGGSVTRGAVFGSGQDSVVITKREFLADIKSTISFSNQAFPINPGLVETFPWLSNMASLFEQWVPMGILFEFESQSGNAFSSTNNALGNIAMTIEYNPQQPNFGTMSQVLNNIWTVSQKPTCSFTLPVECSPAERATTLFYVRDGGVPDNQDQKFYDLGNVQVSTEGMQQDGVLIGKLWISYMIGFMKPKLPTNDTLGGEGFGINFQCGSANAGGTLPFGHATDLPEPNYDSIGVTIHNSPTVQTITFPSNLSGTFSLEFTYRSLGATLFGPLTGVTASAGIDLDSFNNLSNLSGGTMTSNGQIAYTLYFAIDSVLPVPKTIYLSPSVMSTICGNANGTVLSTVICNQIQNVLSDMN